MSYITLPYSTSVAEITSNVLADLQSRFPGLYLSNAHLEVAICEIVARLHGDTRKVMTQVADDIYSYFGQALIGVSRIEARAAETTTTWSVNTTAGMTIPAGTAVYFKRDATTPVVFHTISDVAIPAGSTTTSTGEVIVRATDLGASSNGFGPGPLELLTTLTNVSGVVAEAVTSGGTDTEEAGDYLSRLTAVLTTMSPRPILPADFAKLALKEAGVERATAIDGYNPVDQTLNNERMVAVIVADANGNALSQPRMNEIAAVLDAQREVNFIVRVVAPTYQTIDVAATLVKEPSAIASVVHDNAVTVLRAYLNPATWEWSNTLYYNEIVSLLDRVPGVARVSHPLSNPTGDMTLSGIAVLPKAGNINITVI